MKIQEAINEVSNIVKLATAFGYKRLDNGTELYGHVPHVAPEAWLHSLFVAAKQDEIGAVQDQIGFEFPIEYKELLLINNGMSLFSDSINIYGIRNNNKRTPTEAAWQPYSIVLPNTSERLKGAKSNHFIFGSYSWDGTKLYLDSASGKVYRSERFVLKNLNEWPSLPEMLHNETLRISQLFDPKNGKELDPDLATTP